MRVAIGRIRIGNPAKSVLMVGLRGVGKTVLLDRMRQDAEASGVYTLKLEAPEDRSLPALLAPQLRLILLKLSAVESAKAYATRGLRALAGFAKALKVKFNDIEVGLDLEPELGLADNGDLEGDLAVLLEQVGLAAQSAKTVVVTFIDELQFVKEAELAALITALHRCAQAKLPVTVIGAGLPQLLARAGQAKSYSERLFDYPMVGPLSLADASQAITRPAEELNVVFEPEAIDEIYKDTDGYPYFLQMWSKYAWDVATISPNSRTDVQRARLLTEADLDESFFKTRFERCTPSERRYLRAMASLGSGPHRSGDIAAALGRSINTLGMVRSSLINKGMVWSPSHGDTAFTVPLFDQFMLRAMPGDGWRQV
ncbi:AAA family ATPase [Limnohabitans sp. 2KL-3]|uniref:AAA family ATPase n=1 Tax=Limnohabitans sp. 2KL-3 TaxID=1100700 RepID=UPI000AC47EA5